MWSLKIAARGASALSTRIGLLPNQWRKHWRCSSPGALTVFSAPATSPVMAPTLITPSHCCLSMIARRCSAIMRSGTLRNMQMTKRHRPVHPQGVAMQATCIQPEAGQDRHRRGCTKGRQSTDRTTGETTDMTTSHSTKRDETCAKWLVIAIRLGCHNTTAKSLVIRANGIFFGSRAWPAPTKAPIVRNNTRRARSYDELRTSGVAALRLQSSIVMHGQRVFLYDYAQENRSRQL